jgi:branched-chain amino acid aminotransferase
MAEMVYLNGDLVPSSQAKISSFDYGFLYGYGIFETMRAYNGVIFRLERHLDRLKKAAEALGINSRLVSHNLGKACYDVLQANKLADSRIRLTVSAGEGDAVPNPASCKGITVFIVARKLIPLAPESYEKGFKAIISSWRRNSQSPLSQLKTSCYLENILARQQARAANADEAVILNERGLIAEGSNNNIFSVNQQVLLTPSLNCGVLPGITREALLELAQSLNIKAVEAEIEPEKLQEAEEAFFTNSIIEIMPLTYIGNKPIGTGKPGAITRRLIEAYQKLVADYKIRD